MASRTRQECERKKLKDSMTPWQWRLYRKAQKEKNRAKYLRSKEIKAQEAARKAAYEAERLAHHEFLNTPEGTQLRIDLAIGESSYLTRAESFETIAGWPPPGWTQETWDAHTTKQAKLRIEAAEEEARVEHKLFIETWTAPNSVAHRDDPTYSVSSS